MGKEQEQLSTEEQAPLAEPEEQLSEEGAATEEAGAAEPEEGAAPETFTAEQIEEVKKEARSEVQRIKDPETEAAKQAQAAAQQDREVARQRVAQLEAERLELNLQALEKTQRAEWETAGIDESKIVDYQTRQRAQAQQAHQLTQREQANAQLQSQIEPELKKLVAQQVAERAGLIDWNLLLEAESPNEMNRMAKLLKSLAYERAAASAKVERKPQDFQKSSATPTGKANSRTEVQRQYIAGNLSWDDYEAAKHK